MKSPRSAIVAALVLASVASQAHAITGAICISNKLNGSLKMRATGVCKLKEIQLGSFDGTTLQFSGINVQVVSGSGATNGPVNGKGNLIVGYNEAGICEQPDQRPCNNDADCNSGVTCNLFGSTKTGSHNLVVGAGNGYTSAGGLVAGAGNNISADFASVSGGRFNTASGAYSSVSGGSSNSAPAHDASVSGGLSNTASGPFSFVSGGEDLNQTAGVGWAAGSVTPGNTINGNFESP